MSITRYLEELRIALTGRMPDSTIDSRLKEIKAHLKMSMQEHAQSSFEREAELQAISEMGDAKVIAAQLVRQHRGYGTASARKLSGWTTLIVCLGVLCPFLVVQMTVLNPNWASHIHPLWEVGSVIGIGAFGVQVWRTRRWLAGPVSVWMCLNLFVVTLISLVFATFTLNSADTKQMHTAAIRGQAALEPEREAVASWRRGNPPLDRGPVPISSESQSWLPLSPFPISSQESAGALLQAMPTASAKSAWTQYGALYAQDVAKRNGELWSEAHSATEPATLSNGRIALNTVVLTSQMSSVVFAELLAWNGLFLFLAKGSDRMRNRRFRRSVSAS